jgi:hypothetical protein
MWIHISSTIVTHGSSYNNDTCTDRAVEEKRIPMTLWIDVRYGDELIHIATALEDREGIPPLPHRVRTILYTLLADRALYFDHLRTLSSTSSASSSSTSSSLSSTPPLLPSSASPPSQLSLATLSSPTIMYSAAGVLPYTVWNGEIYFLLGSSRYYSRRKNHATKIQSRIVWADFGGSRDSLKDKDEYDTAAREFGEETLGLFADARGGIDAIMASAMHMSHLLRTASPPCTSLTPSDTKDNDMISVIKNGVFRIENGGYVQFVAPVTYLDAFMLKLAATSVPSISPTAAAKSMVAIERREKLDFAWIPAHQLIHSLEIAAATPHPNVVLVRLLTSPSLHSSSSSSNNNGSSSSSPSLRLFHKFVITMRRCDLRGLIKILYQLHTLPTLSLDTLSCTGVIDKSTKRKVGAQAHRSQQVTQTGVAATTMQQLSPLHLIHTITPTVHLNSLNGAQWYRLRIFDEDDLDHDDDLDHIYADESSSFASSSLAVRVSDTADEIAAEELAATAKRKQWALEEQMASIASANRGRAKWQRKKHKRQQQNNQQHHGDDAPHDHNATHAT